MGRKKSDAPKEPKAKKPRKPRKARATPPTQTIGSNSMDPQRRELFLSDKNRFAALLEAKQKAAGELTKFKKTIKEDGFTVRQIELALMLETPEGEASVRLEMQQMLLAAQYIGAPIGKQLDLLLEPDRTPAVDMAADEGQRDAMESKPFQPGYAEGTPQRESYTKAFYAEQERQIKAGIKPTEPTVDERAETLQGVREENTAAQDLESAPAAGSA
jgi:hypothetical protein